MLTAPSGAAGFAARHPTAVLSAIALPAGLATAAASVQAWLQHPAPLDIAIFAFAAVLVAASAYWHTRHLALALLVALTPLPGMIWAAPLSAGSHFALIPFAAYGFAVAAASLYAQHVLDRVLGERDGEAPWRAVLAVLVMFAGLAALWFRGGDGGDAALQAAADMTAACTSLLLLPLTVPLLRFDETFVARANRARERRGRFTEPLGGASVPRWGLSFTGIVLIFAALGWFGFAHPQGASWWRIAATAAALLVLLGWTGGGWREALGLTLVTATAALVALWWQGYDTRLPFGHVVPVMLAALTGLTGLASARHMRAWRRAGDTAEMVRRRALEDCSGALFAAVSATAALLPGLQWTGAAVLVAVVPLAALAGALAFPAILTAIETLAPRRRSVEEVFGLKRRR